MQTHPMLLKRVKVGTGQGSGRISANTISFRYEPGSHMRSFGAKVQQVEITPAGSWMTEDQAKCALTYDHTKELGTRSIKDARAAE